MSAWCRSPFCMEGTRGPIQLPHGSQSYPHTPPCGQLEKEVDKKHTVDTAQAQKSTATPQAGL